MLKSFCLKPRRFLSGLLALSPGTGGGRRRYRADGRFAVRTSSIDLYLSGGGTAYPFINHTDPAFVIVLS